MVGGKYDFIFDLFKFGIMRLFNGYRLTIDVLITELCYIRFIAIKIKFHIVENRQIRSVTLWFLC